MIVNASGGGDNLNFKVVGGTTRPSNPKENTIWVNTATEITGWIFHATQPAGVEGRVWIATGTSSDSKFNALKKNGIVVYPLTVKQYVSGVWTYKDAFIYQSGAWMKLGLYLYNNGNDYTDKTGGWTTSSLPECQSGGMEASSANNCLEISKTAKPTGSWPALGWITNWLIDFSGCSSLHFNYITEGTASAETQIHFAVINDTSGSLNFIAGTTVNVGNQGELILDVENISAGKVFFYIIDSTYQDNKINLRVSEVWLT